MFTGSLVGKHHTGPHSSSLVLLKTRREPSTFSSCFHTGAEEVFVFSPHPESHAIILEHYGNWPAVYAWDLRGPQCALEALESSVSSRALGVG